MFKKTLLIFLSLIAVHTAFAAAPRLILAASGDGWRDPVYTPDGNAIAFSNAAQSELLVLIRDEKNPRTVVRSEGVGRRFVFEPNSQRIVFRLRANALPERPERLLSSSIYLYDPVHHSDNMTGNLLGPYFFHERVWYRTSLAGPFFDYENNVCASGPYWNPLENGMFALNANLDTVFIAKPDQHIAGAEISPDGRWIAAVESRPAVRIHLIRIENGQTRSIPDAFAPQWSGNSQRIIAISKDAGGNPTIVLMDISTGETIAVLNNPQFQPETPALDFNGMHALFISDGAIYEMELP